MLTTKFKENIKKIKPLYEEIVKLTPDLIEKLQSFILKQSAANQQKCTTPSNENYRANQAISISISSNSSQQSQGAKQEINEAIMKSILLMAQTIKQQISQQIYVEILQILQQTQYYPSLYQSDKIIVLIFIIDYFTIFSICRIIINFDQQSKFFFPWWGILLITEITIEIIPPLLEKQIQEFINILTLKYIIREIEQLTQNNDGFSEFLNEFKKDKTSFLELIGTLEIYWMLRFDKVSTFFQQELFSLQKGMDIFFSKLKQHAQKQIDTSSITSKKKKSSYENQHHNEMRISRQTSQISAQNDSISEASSQNSNEIYYTAKSYQPPRLKISEQISVLEQIPEEELCKNVYSCQSNMDYHNLSYNQSQQSYLESKNEIDNVQIETGSLSQNEMFSISSNFNIVPKRCNSPQYKSILSNSESPQDKQKQSNQSRTILAQTQNFQSFRDQREYSKGSNQYQDRRDNRNPEKQSKPSNSHQTDSTKSQQKPSEQNEMNNISQGVYFERKDNQKVINFQMCFCVSRHN